jgi:hypothetical protein
MLCKVCDEPIPEGRWILGYTTCITHGEPPKKFTLAPAYNKGAYQLITAENVKYIGR